MGQRGVHAAARSGEAHGRRRRGIHVWDNTRRLPKRIVLVDTARAPGNLDESEYTRTPDQIPLTQNGHVQATQTGAMLRDLFDANDDPEYKCFFYISPYRRSKQTALGIAQAFEKRHISGVREEPQLREQDFGNFQDLKQKKAEKRERQYFWQVLLPVSKR